MRVVRVVYITGVASTMSDTLTLFATFGGIALLVLVPWWISTTFGKSDFIGRIRKDGKYIALTITTALLLVSVIWSWTWVVQESNEMNQEREKRVPASTEPPGGCHYREYYDAETGDCNDYPPEKQREVDRYECPIKGNVSYSTGEKIYHIPGQEFYDSTTINEEYGERWFCSEQEAKDAGWRRSEQ